MEFIIKVDLTDDKYTEFAQKTADEIIQTNEFKKAYSEAIKEIMVAAVKEKANLLVLNCLFGSYYRSSDASLDIPKKIVNEAMSEYVDEIKEAFKETMAKSLSNYNIGTLMEKAITNAMLTGMSEGIYRYVQDIDNRSVVTSSELNDLKHRLHIDSNYC